MYAGRSEDLSFTATLAPLAAAARGHAALSEAVTALLPPQPSSAPAPGGLSAPGFVTLTSGLGALPEALAKASGADVRTGAMVRGLSRTRRAGVTVGSAADPQYLAADAVIIADPRRARGALPADAAPVAAAQLAGIPYASMAIITLAFPAPRPSSRDRAPCSSAAATLSPPWTAAPSRP